MVNKQSPSGALAPNGLRARHSPCGEFIKQNNYKWYHARKVMDKLRGTDLAYVEQLKGRTMPNDICK